MEVDPKNDSGIISEPQASKDVDAVLSVTGSASSSDSDLENVYGRLQQLSKSFEGALNLSELDEQLEDLDSPLFNDDPSDDDSADREFNLVVYGNELKSANSPFFEDTSKDPSNSLDLDREENDVGINVVEGPAAERVFRKALSRQQGGHAAFYSTGIIRCNQLTILQGIISIFLLVIIVNSSQELFSTAFIIMVSITSALFLATSIRWLRCPNPLTWMKAVCCEKRKHVTFETMDSDDLDLEMGHVDNKIGIDDGFDSDSDSSDLGYM